MLKKLKTCIHYNIIYNLSLHYAIHPLKNIAHILPFNRKRTGKKFGTNSHSYKMYMTKNPFKRNGSHLYRNVHDKNPYKNIC